MKNQNLRSSGFSSQPAGLKLVSIQQSLPAWLAILGVLAVSLLLAQPAVAQTVTIRSSPATLTVPDSYSGNVVVSNSITLASSPGTVTTSISGLPSGVTSAFDVSSGSATYVAKLTLTFSGTVANGIYPITINANNGGSVTTNANILLTVGRQWAGGSAGNTNWSTAANWSSGPGSATNVILTQTSAQTAEYAVDSVVDQNFTIDSIRFSQTNSTSLWHNLLITNGVTLQVLGAGGFAQQMDWNGINQNTGVAIYGTNGTLVVSNSAATFESFSDSTASPKYTTLDMAQLGGLVVDVAQIGFGDTWQYPYSSQWQKMGYSTSGQFIYPINPLVRIALAMTNSLRSTFVDPSGYNNAANRQYAVGINRAPNKSNGSGNSPYFYFGVVNNIYADSIGFGGIGATTMLIKYNPAITNAYRGSLNTLIRNTNGTGRVSFISIGDIGSWILNTSGNCKPTVDFSAGAQDILVDRFYVGMDATNLTTVGAGGPASQANFITGSGNIDANSLYIGNQFNGSSTNNNYCMGTMTVNTNCLVKVNSTLSLGYTTETDINSKQNPGDTFGSLTINKGGTVWANNITIGGVTKLSGVVGAHAIAGYTPNTIVVNSGGTLVVSNTIGDATGFGVTGSGYVGGTLGQFTLNGTLQLNLDANNPSAKVYATDGGGSTISISLATLKIGSLANVGSLGGGTIELPVFWFVNGSSEGTRASSFASVVMPSGYQGTLVQNPTNTAIIDILISAHTPRNLVWKGYSSSDWDTTTQNWLDAANGNHTNFDNGDYTLFDDSSSVTNINVTSTLQLIPGNSVVSNFVNQYTFGGLGTTIGGSTLTKYGTNNLEIDVSTTFAMTANQGSVTGNSSGAVASANLKAGTTMNFSGTIGAAGVDCFGVLQNYGIINGPTTVEGTGIFTNFNYLNSTFTAKSGALFKNDTAGSIVYASGTSTIQTNVTFVNAGTINADVINNSGTFIDLGGTSITLTSLGNLAGGLFIPANNTIGITAIGSTGLGSFPGAALLSAGSTNTFAIDVTHATNTVLQCVHLSFGASATARSQNGCTIFMNNISASQFAAGQSYHLFDNKGSTGYPPYDTGSSTNTYPVITPAIPGSGLAWDLTQLWTAGNIGVVSANTGIQLTNGLAFFTAGDGKNFMYGNMSWDASLLGYRLQQLTTDLSVGLLATNWSNVNGSWTNTSVTISNQISAAVSNNVVFYRLVFP